MSESHDDDLLAGEGEDETDYDITAEAEEMLLQDDEDFVKSRDVCDDRKSSTSDDADADDVLNLLGTEEDFQVEEKLLYNEDEESFEKRDTKFSSERPQNIKNVGEPRGTAQVFRKDPQTTKRNNNAVQKVNKNVLTRNNKWKRGIGRTHPNSRPNFNKNNQPPRRRNGTVLINPRYEGTVLINENNARLAWDHQEYSQPYQQDNNACIQPWANTQNQQLVNSLVTGLASNFVQASGNMLLPPPQPQPQLHLQFQQAPNIYQPPHNNHYEQPLSFEPPPGIRDEQSMPQPFNVQNQLNSHQMRPPPQPPQAAYSQQIQQQYNDQMPTNRMRSMETRKSSNYQKSYQDRDNNYNRFNERPPSYSNDYHNKTVNYMAEDNYQNRTTNYFDHSTKQKNYDNYNYRNYDAKNFNTESVKPNDENYLSTFRQNESSVPQKTFHNNFAPRNRYKNGANKPNISIPRNDNRIISNNGDNLRSRQGNRRPFVNNTTNTRDPLPEKKIKTNQNNAKITFKDIDEPVKIKIEEKISVDTPVNDDEDEDTRQYRLKIEKQKEERERILRMKEERRKQMMQERQKDELKLPIVKTESQNQSVLDQNFQKSAQFNSFEQSRGKVSFQKFDPVTTQKSNLHIVPPKRQFSTPAPIHKAGPSQRHYSRQDAVSSFNPSNYSQQTNQISAKIDPDLSDDLPNLTFKVTNDRLTSSSATNVPKTEASSSSFMSNRVVVVKSSQKSGPIGHSDVTNAFKSEAGSESSDVGQGFSSFFNNRKVLKKDNELLNTRLVVVNNLSATINADKLMALSRGIGEIQ